MIKSILNYVRYRKIIDDNREELEKKYDVKIDNLYRLGTRVSLSENKYTVLKEYKNSELDIYKNLDEEVKKTITKLDRYFMQKNLVEYIGIFNIDRMDVNLVLVILSFRLFNVVKLVNNNRIASIVSFLGLSIGFWDVWYMIPFGVILTLSLLLNMVLFKKLFV